jgi:hypothetical protein
MQRSPTYWKSSPLQVTWLHVWVGRCSSVYTDRDETNTCKAYRHEPRITRPVVGSGGHFIVTLPVSRSYTAALILSLPARLKARFHQNRPPSLSQNAHYFLARVAISEIPDDDLSFSESVLVSCRADDRKSAIGRENEWHSLDPIGESGSHSTRGLERGARRGEGSP